MKVNLMIDGTQPLAGYINIDPFATDGDGKVNGDISNLDVLVDDGEAEEIVADTILEYFGINMVPNILNGWTRKLQRGGLLKLTSPDLYEIARAIMRHEVDERMANLMLFGEQAKDWQTKKNALSVSTLEEMLQACGLKIIHKRFNNFKVVIEAQRL